MRRLGLRVCVLVVLVAAAALGAACAGGDDQPATTGQRGAERITLANGLQPRGASGRTLALSRVEVPPDVSLPLHTHAGTQVAYVERGTLTFSVKTGSVEVMRGSPDQTPKVVRRIGPGETRTIEPGEWIVEQPSVIHQGSNEGDETVVILLSTLFEGGAAPAIPAE